MRDANGNIVLDNISLEMITPVLQEGTPLNKALFDIAMPSGLICMWSGATVPNGWYLCDGTNGTPDLRDRFIVGSGSTYSIGNTGGSNTVKLTTAQMPSHTHTIGSTEISETFTTRETLNAVNGDYFPGAGSSGQSGTLTIDMGSHTHTASSTGSGSAHENRPPYYALAFIMKA